MVKVTVIPSKDPPEVVRKRLEGKSAFKRAKQELLKNLNIKFISI